MFKMRSVFAPCVKMSGFCVCNAADMDSALVNLIVDASFVRFLAEPCSSPAMCAWACLFMQSYGELSSRAVLLGLENYLHMAT